MSFQTLTFYGTHKKIFWVNSAQNITLGFKKIETWGLVSNTSSSQTALFLAEAHVFDIKFQRQKATQLIADIRNKRRNRCKVGTQNDVSWLKLSEDIPARHVGWLCGRTLLLERGTPPVSGSPYKWDRAHKFSPKGPRHTLALSSSLQ